MQFVTSETTESFVSRTNALLVGSLISIGDISVSIAMAFLSSGGNLLGHVGSRISEDFLGHKPENCTGLLCAEMPERVAMGEVLVNFKIFLFHFGVFNTGLRCQKIVSLNLPYKTNAKALRHVCIYCFV